MTELNEFDRAQYGRDIADELADRVKTLTNQISRRAIEVKEAVRTADEGRAAIDEMKRLRSQYSALTKRDTNGAMTVTPAVFIDDHPVKVPVHDDVREAIDQWAHSHFDDLASRLEAFGLNPHDIVQPEYERIVPAAELGGQ